ncbi:MAG TPA: hypothetical protein VMT11_13585 [Myxococcaceae bacterium]|nr:hypothetical protein [Myxococcaceae bacterium]
MSLPVEAESAREGLVRRWVLANGVGELIGLGGVGLLAAALVPGVQRALPGSVAGHVAIAVLMVGLGAFEGAVVGTAQARALAGTGIQSRAWIRATVLGAVLAWALGMVPSTLMAVLGGPGGPPPGTGPPPAVRLVLAAALGLVAGPILAAVQVRVLRRHAERTWRWLVANGLGWALGMPLVFLGVRTLAVQGVAPGSLALAAATLLGAGAVVGLVEGLFLVRLLQPTAPIRAPADT